MQLKQYEEFHKQQQPLAAPDPSMLADARPPLSNPETSYDAAELNKYLPASAQVEQAAPSTRISGTTTYEPPSRAWQCFAKLQSGFMIGGAVGGSFGFAYGTYAAIKFRHILYLPIAVVQGGAAFGFFLACGMVIRCDELPPTSTESRPKIQ